MHKAFHCWHFIIKPFLSGMPPIGEQFALKFCLFWTIAHGAVEKHLVCIQKNNKY